jgi:2-isopropylmalate synthase
MKIQIYDTTLRDGTQGESVAFSVQDKLRVARKLDEFGVSYIEGGWPGSNDKDAEFFHQAAAQKWQNAKIAAFGSTALAKNPVEEDSNLDTRGHDFRQVLGFSRARRTANSAEPEL